MKHEVVHGDCRRIISGFVAEGRVFTSVITDPPYGIPVAGASWETMIPGTDYWKPIYDVLIPGGYAAVFAAPRLSHRVAVAMEDVGFDIRDSLVWLFAGGVPKGAAALKPAWQPIILARKPGPTRCDSLAIGTSRIPSDGAKGRWPANVVHDGSYEVEEAFAIFGMRPGQQGATRATDVATRKNCYGKRRIADSVPRKDTGTASRFFYCAKASPAEREGSDHPTIKPRALMQWIVRMLANGPETMILDPFAGTGTTIVAAAVEGFSAVGIEQNASYAAVASSRVSKVAR